MSRRDGGLWEDVSGRKHVVVAIYRIRGVEDVDNSRRNFGFEGVCVVIGF